jgi:hypothetical protein
MDIGDEVRFSEIPPAVRQDTPSNSPKFPGFHSTALHGKTQSIIDSIDVCEGKPNAIER